MLGSPTLVINCGSSSLKFALIDAATGVVSKQGLAERLNTEGARLLIPGERERSLADKPTHAGALEVALTALDGYHIEAVGHRVVHGAESFSDSVAIDEHVLGRIRACSALAPLHNPANLIGIEAARRAFPNAVHVAVFDTAFHQTLPPKAFLYAIPYELYEKHQVRRYGFHGTSHRFVAEEAAQRLNAPLGETQLVTAHLGNGCSACAVRGGLSVDTTMGLTPLEGLVMGTRSGDVDPNLHQFLAERTGMTLDEITELLNKQSGLLGLSGTSNDLRTLLATQGPDSARATLAIDVFCYRLAKAILGLCAALDRVDALVFTGGIGEHSALIRAQTIAQLAVLRPELDIAANLANGASTAGRITTERSKLTCLVVPTNEEWVIAREAARLAALSVTPRCTFPSST
jgi:acetate kinase